MSGSDERGQDVNASPQQGYRYNLFDMLPGIGEAALSDDEIAKNKSKKKGYSALNAERTENNIIIEGLIHKFLNKHHNCVKRYLVLN